MLTQSDIAGISTATKTREALMQARRRSFGDYDSTPRVSGPRYKIDDADTRKFPVFDRSGNKFAEPLMRKDRAIEIPSSASEGSILEYKDHVTGDYYYGKVVGKDTRHDRIEVENISSKEAEELIGTNEKTKVYSLGDSDVAEFKGSGIMNSLMSILDPSENLIFKLFTLLLIGNIFETESITDIFMAVYVRIVGLAISIIAVVYVSTVFFG